MRTKEEILHDASICEKHDGCTGCSRKECDTMCRAYLIKELKELVSIQHNTGMEDAWEIARNIVKGIHNRNIFNVASITDIFRDHTAQEAKVKIETWEEKKNIHVGDVVKNLYNSVEVTITRINGDTFEGISKFGLYMNENINNWEKTGKHIDLTDLFKQIGA